MAAAGVGDDLDADDPYSSAFNPTRLTVPQLRSLLLAHTVYVPSSARKAGLIEAYESHIRSNADELRAARNRNANIRPDARGITSMSGSPLERPAVQNSPGQRKSIGGSNFASPDQRQRRSNDAESLNDQTIIYNAEADSSLSEERRPRSALSRGSTPRSRRSVSWADSVHTSDEEEEVLDDSVASDDGENRTSALLKPVTSNFSRVNPFQRVSSTVMPQVKQRSTGRKSEPAPRQILSEPLAAVSDGPKGGRHSIGAPSRKRSSLASQTIDSIEQKPASPAKRHPGPRRPRDGAKISKPAKGDVKSTYIDVLQITTSLCWTFMMVASFAYYAYYVSESKTIGFCDPGQASNNLLDLRRDQQFEGSGSSKYDSNSWKDHIPSLPEFFYPSCTPCPPHAICEEGRLATCEVDFILQRPLLAQVPLVRSVLPPASISPRCVPDEEKVMLAADLGDEIESHLRLRKGDVLCRRAHPKGHSVRSTLERNTADTRFALPVQELFDTLRLAAERGSALRGHDESFFEELWNLAIYDLQASQRIRLIDNVLVTEKSALGMGLSCRIRIFVSSLWLRLRLAVGCIILLSASILWLRSRLLGNSSMDKRARSLVDVALGKLQRAKQRSRAMSSAPFGSMASSNEEPYLSIAQLRDTVLRHESRKAVRKQLWSRVSRAVESNTNVRTRQAKVQGEWGRVWEWVGPLDEWHADNLNNGSSAFPYSPMTSLPSSRAVSAGGWTVQQPIGEGQGHGDRAAWDADGSNGSIGADSSTIPALQQQRSASQAEEQHGYQGYHRGVDRKTSAVV